MTDDIRNLLGGYATGTLTEAERKALFEAALQDQSLFEALAGEQALKELLEDPAARAGVLRATEEPRFSAASVFQEWLQKPVAKALVAAGAVLVIAIAVSTVRESWRQPPQQARVEAPVLRPPEPLSAMRPPEATPADATSPRPSSKQQAQKPPEKPAGSAPAAAPPPPAMVSVSEPSPQPPAASSKLAQALTRTVTRDDSRVEYTLFVRDPAGEFRPVSPETLLDPTDNVRLRLRSNRAGYLNVTAGPKQLFSGYLIADEPVNIPASGSFTMDSPEAATVKLALTPMNPQLVRSFRAGSPESVQAPPPRSKAARVPQQGGVVGGVPSGLEPSPAPPILIEIPLQRK